MKYPAIITNRELCMEGKKTYIIKECRNNLLLKLEYSDDDCYVTTEDAAESNHSHSIK